MAEMRWLLAPNANPILYHINLKKQTNEQNKMKVNYVCSQSY